MNSFGRIFRLSIFGESHGDSVGILVDGCPAGLSLSVDDFVPDLERRKGGIQKATTPRQEEDMPKFLSGIFNGRSTGAPIAIMFANTNVRSEDYEKMRDIPRPGHADLVASIKSGGYQDYRGGGHYSGRLTVALVAAGVIAKKILETSSPTPLQRRGEQVPNDPLREKKIEPRYMRTAAAEWSYMVEFAKQNRKHSTKTEEIVWEALRNRKLDGFKFRRQHPINVFIPDFVCLEKNVIVEIDGEYHNDPDQRQFDEMRDRWLKEFNYKMIRLTNEEILHDFETSLQKIRAALKEERALEGQSSPSPLERGAGGEVQSSKIKITASILEIAGESDLDKGIQKAIDAKDSVGGIIECVASNLPAGLGEPFFDSVESVIAHLALSIPAVKAIEFGAGFKAARMFGSEHNDPHIDAGGTTSTNHAGGVVGGLSNGNDLVFRIAVKPTSSTPKEQNTFNLKTGEMESVSIKGRHDLCIALRVPVVLEAVTAIALADLLLLEQRIPRIL